MIALGLRELTSKQPLPPLKSAPFLLPFFLDEKPCTDRLLRTPARTRACRSCAARRRSRNTPEPEGADRTCSARPTLAVEGLQYRLSVRGWRRTAPTRPQT